MSEYRQGYGDEPSPLELDEQDQPRRIIDCKCGNKIAVWTGADVQCSDCGRWFNSAGQMVRFPLYDSPIPPAGFDPADAGERWDDDY